MGPILSSTGLRIAGLWLVTRVVVLLVSLTPAERVIRGDVSYYWRHLQALPRSGISSVMPEYPVPAVWALQLPMLVSGGTPFGYLVAFVALMLALDAGFTWLVRRSGRGRGPGHDWPTLWWIGFVPAVGPLAYFRFDLVPAVLVGGALLLAVRRPAVAGALAALGGGLKLWPALVWPALMARRDGTGGVASEPRAARLRTTIGFGATGVVLAGVSLLAGGWGRLVSPLTWQSDRGLQIESLPATPLMVARAVRPDVWQVALSKYNAFEIVTGPGLEVMLSVASVATAAGLLLILGLVALAALRRDTDPWRVGLVVLAVLLVTIITNKTFSPQYVIWLAGPVVVLLRLGRTDAVRRGTAVRIAVAVLVVAALTQLVYPLTYPPLFSGGPGLEVSTVVLAVRNVALLALTGWVIALAARRGPEARRSGPEKTGPR